jgi:hypothetical protein
MKPERKKEIRSLVHTVPTLIKAHMVNQAFETEKVIAATFDLSDPFLEIVGGKIPQNHIEKVQEVYSDLMYKSFNVGLKSGEVKTKSVEVDKNLAGPELDHELDIKMPMYFGVKQDLMLMFKEQLGEILDTVPDIKENLALQFEKDVEGAYREGLKEFLSLESPVENTPNSDEEIIDEGTDVVDDSDEEIEVDLDDDLDDLDADENVDDEEDDESALQEDVDVSFDSVEDAEDEHVKATVVASALDATAATALKVWEAYASTDLKELFREQSKAGLHRDNAQMVQGFSDWLVKGNKAELYIPFESNVISNEVDKSVLNRLEQYAKLLKNSTAEKVLRYTLGLPVSKKAKASVVSAEDKSIASKLEAYTKLLKDPMAEKVLRYTLGLPIKKVSASVSNMVGTYDPEMLRNKIISSIKSHKIEAGINDFETIIVDCVVSGIDKMPEEKALRKLGKALDIKASSMNAFEMKVDVLAQKLDDALQLPGDIVFVNIDGDYCLTYNMKPEDISRIQGSTKKKSNLTSSDRSQIEALSRLSKSKTIRDIQRASEKASAHIKKILSDIRFGKVGIVEGSSKLRASLEEVIADVFGVEGINYYKQLKRN